MKFVRKLTITILIGFFGSCSDYVDLNKEEILKYTWLRPFVFPNDKFEGHHNLDLGIMEFEYHYLDSSKNIIVDMNNVIISNDWNQVRIGDNYWVKEKEVNIYNNKLNIVKMEIGIDTLRNVINFNVH